MIGDPPDRDAARIDANRMRHSAADSAGMRPEKEELNARVEL